jgi:poly(A) polymerase
MSSINNAEQGALEVVRTLRDKGFRAYWAGGCVRDMLMGKEPEDFDIATDAPPEAVLSLFPNALPVGKAFGVVLVRTHGHNYEVATFRKDLAYHDGRRPHAIAYATVEEDAQRRDFTINAMFHDPLENTTLDLTGGQDDIRRGIVRCVGDADTRFEEDHLRMLRAVRFASILGFEIERETAQAIRAHAPRIKKIARERIGHELARIFTKAKRRGATLHMLDTLFLLPEILPEVARLKGVAQPPKYHPEGDVFTHTVRMLDLIESEDCRLAFAALLHDIGKPDTQHVAGGTIRFHGHDRLGSEMARAILMRLRFSRGDTQDICHCIANHRRFASAQHMRHAKIRRLMASPTFDLELALHWADRMASNQDLSNYDFLKRLQEDHGADTTLPTPLLTGHDIMNLGISEGPEVGRWQRLALDYQLEHPEVTKQELAGWLTAQFSG